MLGIAKPGVGPFELAVPLDINRERAVRQNVGDVVVGEKGLERSQPDHVVGQLGGERVLFDLVEFDPLIGGDLADQLGHFDPQDVPRDAAGDRRVDPRHQRGADALFQLFAASQIDRRRRRFGGNQYQLTTLLLDDAAPEADRPHFVLHHLRRRGSTARPDSSKASAAIASLNLPRWAAATAAPLAAAPNTAGWNGITLFGRNSRMCCISSSVIAWRPPSPSRLTTRRLRCCWPSPSPMASRNRTVSRAERKVSSATTMRKSAMSSALRKGAEGVLGTSTTT